MTYSLFPCRLMIIFQTIDNQRNGLETRYDWDANFVIRAIT